MGEFLNLRPFKKDANDRVIKYSIEDIIKTPGEVTILKGVRKKEPYSSSTMMYIIDRNPNNRYAMNKPIFVTKSNRKKLSHFWFYPWGIVKLNNGSMVAGDANMLNDDTKYELYKLG